MTDQTIIFICGLYCLGFALFHTQFWRLFNWKQELEKLSAPNKAIMQIANVRLIYFFVFVATICFIFPEELATTTFGNFFVGGMSLFWIGRTIEQFVFLKIDHPMVHLLTYIFIIGAILFALPLLMFSYQF
jgi:hypothetical protein